MCVWLCYVIFYICVWLKYFIKNFKEKDWNEMFQDVNSNTFGFMNVNVLCFLE